MAQLNYGAMARESLLSYKRNQSTSRMKDLSSEGNSVGTLYCFPYLDAMLNATRATTNRPRLD